MTRKFKRPDYEEVLKQTISLEEALPSNHLARFVVDVIAQLDLGSIYAQYALGSYWRWDPKEVWSLITWLFYAALLHERLAAGWRGRRAALMAIIGFVVLSFTFVGASLWLSDYHSFRNLGG